MGAFIHKTKAKSQIDVEMWRMSLRIEKMGNEEKLKLTD